MALEAGDIDEALIASAGAVLINGTHLSTAQCSTPSSVKAVELARARGGKVVFDVDYRPVLWGLTGKDLGENRFVALTAVTDRLQQVLPLCDLIVGTEEEIHILGGTTTRSPRFERSASGPTRCWSASSAPTGCVALPGRDSGRA